MMDNTGPRLEALSQSMRVDTMEQVVGLQLADPYLSISLSQCTSIRSMHLHSLIFSKANHRRVSNKASHHLGSSPVPHLAIGHQIVHLVR